MELVLWCQSTRLSIAADVRSIRPLTLVSHSDSNNKHAKRTRQVWSGRQFRLSFSVTEVPYIVIFVRWSDRPAEDQSQRLGFSKSKWKTGGKLTAWRGSGSGSKTVAGLSFVYDRIVDSNVANVSDAGMVYYVVTGDEAVAGRNCDNIVQRRKRAFMFRRQSRVARKTIAVSSWKTRKLVSSRKTFDTIS
jgi:hypothetical protein